MEEHAAQHFFVDANIDYYYFLDDPIRSDLVRSFVLPKTHE